MSFLDKLERVFGRLAIPNLTLYLVIGQVFVLLSAMLHVLDLQNLIYAPVLVMAGQWWRMFTFIFVMAPPNSTLGYVFLVFGWYLFYLMGGALENHWGTFRYNAFFFLNFVLTVAVAFLVPRYAVENTFILGSVFIAFAYLYPDFEFILFFILPVKVKWLALLACVFGAYRFIVEGMATRLHMGAAIVTFLLFFGADILRGAKNRQRRAAAETTRAVEREAPRHVCYVCGKNDRTHPQLDFRYCSKCAGDQCYCPEHIQNHAHVVAPDDAKAT